MGLVAIVVDDYDSAIGFFVNALGFELAEDSPALTNDGRPKRWVVVRPRGGVTGLLLAQADGDVQAAAVGNQTAGRVGFFLNVEDFGAAYARMTAAGVQFLTEPRTEPYGQVAVFRDIVYPVTMDVAEVKPGAYVLEVDVDNVRPGVPAQYRLKSDAVRFTYQLTIP